MNAFQFARITACLLLGSFTASGVVLEQQLYRHFVKEADLIVAGEVVDKTFRSGITESETLVPHTFVTIRIAETFKGRSENPEQLTLRIEGGLSEDRETISITSGTPLLDAGDTGIFFVRGDPETGQPAADPLVGLKQGFTRFLADQQVMNEMAYELILTSDPAIAARLHPRDVRNYGAFIERLSNPRNEAEARLADRLSKETRLLIERPGAVRELSSQELTFRMDENKANQIREMLEQDNTGRSLRDLLQTVLPQKFRVQSRSPQEALLYRDLTHALFERDLFLPEHLQGVDLRPVTQELVEQDPFAMPLDQVLKRNRRVLEDLFPQLIIRSLQANVVLGRYRPIEEMMTTQYGEHQFQMQVVPLPEGEGEGPATEAPPDGQLLDQGQFVDHLQQMIEELHTSEELEKTLVIRSFEPEERFRIKPLPVVAPPHDLTFQPRPPRNPDEAAELEQLRESQGNPVLGNR